MKIGICCGAKQISSLKTGTADYAELNLGQIYHMSGDEIKETKRILDGAGLTAETSNCFFPGEIKLCGKRYKRDIVAEYCKKALDKGAALGIEICVLGSSGSRNIENGENADECIKQLEESVFCIGEVAKAFDMTVALEPLNKRETNVFNTLAEGAEFVKRVNHKNVMLLADIYHIAAENDNINDIFKYRDIIKHIHIARPKGRLFPAENDGFDYSAVKSLLDRAGYDLRISIEGGCEGEFKSCAEESIEFLKSTFNR